MKRIFFSFSYFLSLLMLTAIDGAIAEQAIDPSSLIVRQIQYGFTLRNATNNLLKDVDFWTYGPVKSTSNQRCLSVEASQPYELIVDDLGNQILHFRFELLPPYAIRPVIIRATVKFTDIPDRTRLSHPEQFLSPAEYIESDDPELQRFAESLRSKSSQETARNIFRWVSENIVYSGYLRDSRGALYAFKNRRGDCTEYMFLFAAMCRADGIPARGVGGYLLSRNGILEPEAYHDWAEFYDEGVWNIADPQRRVFLRDASQYLAMRIIAASPTNPMGTSHRYRCSTEGVEATMTSPTNPQGM